MQQTQTQNSQAPRLSTSSHSSLSAATNNIFNGLLPHHRLSQVSNSLPSALLGNTTPNQNQLLQKNAKILKRSEKLKHACFVILLTIILALLLITTIELGTNIFELSCNNYSYKFANKSSRLIQLNNQTNIVYPIRSFFTYVWTFNFFLLILGFIVHLILIQRRSRRGRTINVFLREFGRVFVNGKSHTQNLLIDCLVKTLLLCLLWYFFCYLIFRSMAILVSIKIIILYSITVTSRQLFGWIFLHEQFIGNKVIAYILALSAFLFLAHDDGFRFNTCLLGLSMVICAVGLKTIFDILVYDFVKDLTNVKLRIVMINVCLLGTCLLWPLNIIFHLTNVERFEYKSMRWFSTLIALCSSLTYTLLTIVVPFKYSSTTNVACFLIVIPITAIIDQHLLKINYSSLALSAIACSLLGILLSMIPKQWFHASETTKMKQALGLLNKDSTPNALGTTVATASTGTSSAFEEIRAQRRIRNALFYNEIKA